jgi:PAS domain-containing protein
MGRLNIDIEARKRAEEALRESEEKYRTLFETIDSGYALTDLVRDQDGRVIDLLGVEFNRNYTRHSGLPPFAGQRATDVITVDPEWLRQYEEVTRTGLPSRHENYIQDGDRWVSTYFSLVGELGSDRVAVVFDDITERKRAEESLRESEERQAFLLKLSDAIRPLTGPADIQGETTRLLRKQLNAGWCYYVDWDLDRMIGLVVRDSAREGLPSLAGSHDVSDAPEFLQLLARGGLMTVRDYANYEQLPARVRENFSALGFRSMMAAPLFKEGRLAATLLVGDSDVRDWSPSEASLFAEAAERTWAAIERARAEQALREGEEKYRTLFEAMDEGFAICELVRDSNRRAVDYRYVEVNPAVVRHVGISPEALQGRLASEIFGDLDPWLLATYARVVDEGRSIVTDHLFAHVDRWLHINVFPRGGDCIAAVYSDVSERKRAEQTLRDSEHRQAFLLRFTDAIRSEPNEQALIARAVQMLAEELAADRAYATRHYPDQDLTHVVHEVRGPDLIPLPSTLRFSDFPEAGRQTFENTLVFEDTANDQSLTDTDKASLAAMGVGAMLSRPLRRDGSPVFALGVVSTLPRRWTSAEIALVEEATERAWEAAERARAAAALRESEEKYAALFAASPAPFLILGPDAPHFTIADVNDAYLAATMRTREDLVGRVMFEAFPDNPDDPAADGVSTGRVPGDGVAGR